MAAATSALAHGRFDDALALAAARPSNDAAATTVRARLAILQGRYEDAEKWLAPVAARHRTGDAALELGLLHGRQGRRDELVRLLSPVLAAGPTFKTPREMARAAVAARALNRTREANGYFRAAAAAAPDDPLINTAWGELLLEKHNRQDAARSFRSALRADEQWVPAQLGLARTVIDENPSHAQALAERALAVAPSLADVHVLRAELALIDDRPRDAERAAADALTANPASLEARARLAAIAYLEDRQADYEAEVAKALVINSAYGEIHRIAGSHAAKRYLFDDAVRLVREALRLDPENARAHAELGMHLLRAGDEPAARKALERAFELDRFDVITYNLLSLLDTLDGFDTIQDGEITLRMHPDETPVLLGYLQPLVRDAFHTLSEQYGFTPAGPILIQVFPRHDDFAVRNIGLPGLVGALGACFGRVVTMGSPRSRPPGSFDWGATMWHEIAHVFTLQMSNQRVPRWLTEGISVYEEQRARPEWGREMEITFARLLDRGEVLPLTRLNAGFTRPETIALAYYQASLLVEHIVEEHGQPALLALVRAFGEGLSTDEALQKTVEVDLAGLQDGFNATLERRFGPLRAALRAPEETPAAAEEGEPASDLARLEQLAASAPDHYQTQLALGQALLEAGRLEDAAAALRRADELVPMAKGPDSPRALLAEIALQKEDAGAALHLLRALLTDDHLNLELARRVASLAEELEDEAAAAAGYERILFVDPFDGLAQTAYGRLALRRGESEPAVRAFEAALALEPLDRVGAHTDLAEGYLLSGNPQGAWREAITALEMAPTYERAQDLLLRAAERR